ncbi:DUF7848 domain-containing protein [Streptomyces laculatispora]|uniref:DUF7848 domain-containing protein n=1 Tax=Streptomyces laculatispora TaxID=887464 RepID=UPI001A93BD31|nr:hypothetical protein [Streptomyces laculatispora]MBO0917552.1 hypothetical protein [Streptomyces laculatispora]
MGPRSVMRFVEWTIGAPRGEAPQTVIQVRCLEPDCGEESEPSRSHIDPDLWALKHAGRTRHTEYEEVARCRLVAAPKEGQ